MKGVWIFFPNPEEILAINATVAHAPNQPRKQTPPSKSLHQSPARRDKDNLKVHRRLADTQTPKAMAGLACTQVGSTGFLLRRPDSRTLQPCPQRPRLGRSLQIANIASPAREPITLPPVVPETALIDEVSSPT